MGATLTGVLDSYQKGSSTTLLNGLISYWKLDELSGNAIDIVGSHNGTPNTVTQGSAGKIGTSYLFTGVNYECVNVGDISAFNLQAFSISCWSIMDDAEDETLVSKYYYTGDGMFLMQEYGWIKIKIQDDSSHSCEINTGGVATTGSWQHVIATFDGTNLNLYVDGSKIGTGNTFSYDISYPTDSYFQIGGKDNNCVHSGNIDEVGYWNRELTSTEIATLWNSGAGKAYPFS